MEALAKLHPVQMIFIYIPQGGSQVGSQHKTIQQQNHKISLTTIHLKAKIKINLTSLKALLNNSVFTHFLKAKTEGTRQTSRGRTFQRRAAITKKTQPLVPTSLASLAGGTILKESPAERSSWVG